MSYPTIKNITLDIYNNSIVCINAKQSDTSRSVEVTCTEYGKKILLDKSKVKACVRYTKPDGTISLYDVIVLDNNNIKIELTQQMLSVAGRCIADVMLLSLTAELEIYNNEMRLNQGAILSTMPFYINVLASSVDHDKVESSDEYQSFINSMQRMIALDKRLNDNEDVRIENEETRERQEGIREQQESNRIKTFNTNEANRIKTFNDNETGRINTFNTNETNRQDTFEKNEKENRQDVFDSNEADRIKTFNDNETGRINTFDTNETNRQNTFEDNEQTKRQDVFDTNEDRRTKTFNDNEDGRINTFNTNELDRQNTFEDNEQTKRQDVFDTNETNRINEFSTNETNRQSTFESNEKTKRQDVFDSNEASRINEFSTNETNRQSEFDTNESGRIKTFEDNETNRQSTFEKNESNRQNTFDINESNRQDEFDSNENDRITTFNERMDSFDSNEQKRQDEFDTNEGGRISRYNSEMQTWNNNVTTLISNCNTAENLRVEAENDRKSSEAERISNEQSRITAETNREINTANAILECNTATTNANNAADNANTATDLANQATTYAQNATTAFQDIIEKLSGVENFDTLEEFLMNKLGQVENNLSNISNPNLFINGDFQVWQRGTSFQTSNNYDYSCTADRWMFRSKYEGSVVSVEKVDNGIQIDASLWDAPDTCRIVQPLDKLSEDEIYTISAKINGEIISSHFKGGSDLHDNKFSVETIIKSDETNNYDYEAIGYLVGVVVPSGSVSIIEWVKLEKGSIATPFVPRQYTEELMLCRRYYYIIPYGQYQGGTTVDGKKIYIHNDWILNNMNSPKTITGYLLNEPHVSISSNGSKKDLVVKNVGWNYNAIELEFDVETFKSSSVYLYFGNQDAKIIVDAEIYL